MDLTREAMCVHGYFLSAIICRLHIYPTLLFLHIEMYTVLSRSLSRRNAESYQREFITIQMSLTHFVFILEGQKERTERQRKITINFLLLLFENDYCLCCIRVLRVVPDSGCMILDYPPRGGKTGETAKCVAGRLMTE